MAVNLVGTVGAEPARELLEASFAQFQADRSVVGLARQVHKNEETMAVYAVEAGCDAGDFAEYFAIRMKITQTERALARTNAASRRIAVVESVSRLKIGDVIRVPSGRRSGLAIVLDPGMGAFGEPRPLVLTEDRWAGRIPAAEFTAEVEPLAKVRVPKHFNHRSPQERRDLASTLRQVVLPPSAGRRGRGGKGGKGTGAQDELDELRRQLRRHPCHACPEREDHARWAERRARLDRDTDTLREKVRSRKGSLARTFDRVCAVLERRGYLADGAVTEYGRTLSRLWTEADLLVAECLRRGLWDGLNPAELAAAVSVVVYEARRDTEEHISVPRGPVGDAVDATVKLWAELESDENAAGLQPTREPDLGFVWPIYRWARGESLSKVLASGPEVEMPAGDFVRWARQVVDLLGQVAEAAGTESTLRSTARAAMDALNRGVLAYSSVG
jgi:ATP-dependent RNA helicase HelY